MRLYSAILIGCGVVFNTSPAVAQQPTMTTLVPQLASHAVMFRNVNELKERGDVVASELGFPFGMTSLFSIVGSQLLVGKAADDDLPCGTMWFEPELIGEPEVKQTWQKPIAAAVAISDTKKLAEVLQVDHEELVAGMIVEKDHSVFGHKSRFYRMVGRYLWVVSHKKLYDVLKDARPLAQSIPRSRLESIDSADFLIEISAKASELNQEASQTRAERWLKAHKELDVAEADAIREWFSILYSTSYCILSGRIDRGFEFCFQVFFDHAASPGLRQRIVKFSPPAGGVSLKGLPAGELLFGHAARTDSTGFHAALTATVRESHGFWWPGLRDLQKTKIVSQVEQLKLLGLFGEIWPLTNRYKVGLYREENTAAHGLVSMAAILETEDPERLMPELDMLAALVDRTALDPAGDSEAGKKTVARVRKLILQLGDDEYQQRQSATTRLVLIGEPALPLVAEARLSKLPEVAKRATQIEKLIQEDLKEKRNAALDSSVFARAKPVFIFHPDAEQRVGTSVDIMEVRVNERSELKHMTPVLFGPEWSRIRVVKFDKHVAVFFGSNLERLDQMITNVKSLQQGNNVAAPDTTYGSPLLSMRGAEFQGSIARITRLIDGQRLTEKEREKLIDPELSSASVTIDPDFLAVEWRVSLPDLKAIRKLVK
jgi:hypothetical protein